MTLRVPIRQYIQSLKWKWRLKELQRTEWALEHCPKLQYLMQDMQQITNLMTK
jgi:hypothetical protein